MKRRREQDHVSSKRHKVELPFLKRKNTFEMLAAPKRQRHEEHGVLQRQLIDAYARIDFLEKQVQQLEYLAAITRAQNYPAYNPEVKCY